MRLGEGPPFLFFHFMVLDRLDRVNGGRLHRERRVAGRFFSFIEKFPRERVE
jgi:hypothetical protein